MFRVNKFLFCISLKCGGQIIGWLHLINMISFFSYFTFLGFSVIIHSERKIFFFLHLNFSFSNENFFSSNFLLFSHLALHVGMIYVIISLVVLFYMKICIDLIQGARNVSANKNNWDDEFFDVFSFFLILERQ